MVAGSNTLRSNMTFNIDPAKIMPPKGFSITSALEFSHLGLPERSD